MDYVLSVFRELITQKTKKYGDFFFRILQTFIHRNIHLTPHKRFCMVEHMKGRNTGRVGQAAARRFNL